MSSTVFLSYAREDYEAAERLYMDLRRAEIPVWMDKKNLLPGQNWEHEIRKAIRGARYFLALISKTSTQKRGFVQREMRFAMDVLDEVPIDQVFLIPVRLDDSDPPDFEIQAINRVDLFPSYRKGIERLLAVISDVERRPLVALDPKLAVSLQAPIEFTPYRSFESFVRGILQNLPEQANFHDRDFSYFITYRTTEDDVVLPARIRDAYPDQITVVLRSGYKDLLTSDSTIRVTLKFGDEWEQVHIPYTAIDSIAVPAIHLLVQRQSAHNDA